MSGGDYFVAVHGGAGYHHPDHDQRTRRALRLCVMRVLYPRIGITKFTMLLGCSFRACTKALQSLLPERGSGCSEENESLTLVEQAIVSLENDPYLNAGYGSNLTLDGTVECDAAIFSTGNSPNGFFGSVGAISGEPFLGTFTCCVLTGWFAGIKNPISAARSVLEYSRKPDNLGRVPPM